MKSQHADEADPITLIKRFNREKVRYLLIGSMALSMHGAPIGSADWDFWVAGEDRVKTYNIFKRLGLHGRHSFRGAVKQLGYSNYDWHNEWGQVHCHP